ncbi:MAG: hypothetical protein NTU79_03325 [Planctomycetota bacterium]|nr:hypothetical protein [Planctomycetota bacterium]
MNLTDSIGILQLTNETSGPYADLGSAVIDSIGPVWSVLAITRFEQA